MKLALSEEQEMLRTSARDFFAARLPKKTVEEIEQSEKGYSPEMWAEMAGLGWMGLVLPEKYSGAGMAFLDLAILIEEMGRACLPGPFFSTAVLGAMPIIDLGTDAQKQEYLPKIASGEKIFTLALTEESARYDAANIKMKATADGDGFVLNGTKMFVPDANVADYMLVVARTNDKGKAEDGLSILVVDARSPGIKVTVLKTMAGDKLCEVNFQQVKVPKANALGQVDKAWSNVQKIVQRAAAAKCCEIVGCIQRALEMTVEYAKQRKQYGKPIGTFQVLQHYCADMAIDVEGVRLSAYQAAWMVNEGISCAEQVAIAKAYAGDAASKVMASAHQIHGAIGCTLDHDLQYYTRRAKAAELTFGDASFYRQVVAGLMGL